jgi:hypothetical protein
MYSARHVIGIVSDLNECAMHMRLAGSVLTLDHLNQERMELMIDGLCRAQPEADSDADRRLVAICFGNAITARDDPKYDHTESMNLKTAVSR